MKTQTVYLRIKAEIELPDTLKIEEVLHDLDYEIRSQTDGSQIRKTEIVDWDVSH